MAPLGAPVLPLNLGTLGFIAAVRPAEWEKVFDLWLLGKAPLSRRLMLEARVEREQREISRLSCLNDIVITASERLKMVRLQVFSNVSGSEESVILSTMRLGEYRSDGLLIAAPTGSTAYSVAAGGPVVDPEMEVMILNPICPFTLSYRPIVLPANETVLVEVEQAQRSGVILNVDGQVTEPLEPGDRIFISPALKPGLLVASGRHAFYQALQTKFFWMEIPGKELSQKEKDGVSYA
jgi:NAD+ kinase